MSLLCSNDCGIYLAFTDQFAVHRAVQSALRKFIVLLANAKNTTRILDAVLLLSSWSGNLDVWQYIVVEHRSLITPLQHAFESVLAEEPMVHQHERCVLVNS